MTALCRLIGHKFYRVERFEPGARRIPIGYCGRCGKKTQ